MNKTLTNIGKSLMGVMVMLVGFAVTSHSQAQSIVRVDDGGYDPRFSSYIEPDPNLYVEIWTDNETGVYYEGEEINIYFRANMDCYVSIYNIDTYGRVNLLYPFDQMDDPYIEGGRIYRIPSGNDDYQLIVDGPAGTENIQIVASRTPFPTPNWYDGSGLVCDRDRYEFISYINGKYFGCHSGCLRATDQVSFVVREWDDYYYRPVYYHPWPSWRHYGYVYIDYWWGSTVYIDGFYYGIAPLCLPRIALGHHVVTVYDSHGYCWEGSVVIERDRPFRLDDKIIRTNAGTESRYRSVRKSGYLTPAKNGYRDVNVTSKVKPRTNTITRSNTISKTDVNVNNITTDRAGNSTKGVVSREANTGEYKSKSRGFGYKRVDGSSSRLSPVGGAGAKGQSTESRGSNGKSDAKAESAGSDRLKAFKTPRANSQSWDNNAGAANTWKPMDRSSSGALQGQSTKGVRNNRLQPFDQSNRPGTQNSPGVDYRGKSSAQPGTSTRLKTATPKRTSPPTSTPKATKSSTPPKSSKASSGSKAPKKQSRPAPAKKAPPKKASKGKKSDK